MAKKGLSSRMKLAVTTVKCRQIYPMQVRALLGLMFLMVEYRVLLLETSWERNLFRYRISERHFQRLSLSEQQGIDVPLVVDALIWSDLGLFFDEKVFVSCT